MNIEAQSLLVTHVAEDMSTITGGVPAVIYQLSRRLFEGGISSEVAYAVGDSTYDGVLHFKYPPSRFGRLWFYSHQLQRGLKNLLRPFRQDLKKVLHIHGVWSAPQFFSAVYAFKSKTPFIFSAHGMLEPWLWDRQGFINYIKKKVYWYLFVKNTISRASVIHAITPLEANNLSKLFPSSHIEVIPNAVDVADIEELPKNPLSKRILFLGRIEPKKGVDVLLEAFSDADLESEWILEIVGPVWSENYYKQLCKIVDSRNMQARIFFLGPLFGLEKQQKIDSSWVLIAPSHSEVIGLVNLEASSRAVPSITTYQTGLYDWEDGGGILIEPNVNSLTKAIKIACSWTLEERIKKGILSHELVKVRYSWDVVIKQWINLYLSILSEDQRAR